MTTPVAVKLADRKYRIQRRQSDARPLDINDLAAGIVGQAAAEWREQAQGDYEVVCFGDRHMGFKRCQYLNQCYPDQRQAHNPKGARFKRCLYKWTALRLSLVEFFNSTWFEMLCGGVDPAEIRRKLGVPER